MRTQIAQTPLIIELRCNETAYKTEKRPHLPYSPAEVIESAVTSWKAGASILHWHGRNPETGVPQNDVDLYTEVYRGVRTQTDLLTHPTLGFITQTDIHERVKHILAVQDNPELCVDMAPVDFGSINVDFWNPEQQDFVTRDQVYYNPRLYLERVLTIFKQHHVFVSAVCWNVGQMRTARCFQQMGLLSEKTFWEFVFTGDIMPEGTAPTMHGLQAMVEEVPEGQPWSVLCWNGDAMQVAAWAITLGGHVSIGLGDHHYDRLSFPTNAQLVQRIVDMAGTLGRPIATPAQTRDILGIAARTHLPTRTAHE